MPRVRNSVARFVCAAVSAIAFVGGVSNWHDHRRVAAIQGFAVGALFAAII